MSSPRTTPQLLLLVLAAIGFARHAAAQDVRLYYGGVTNDDLKAQPATLNISLYRDTAEVVRGYLTIGAPLAGGGYFIGTQEGDSLLLVTVSQSGDTISWHSTTSGAFIGGPYFVVGGPYRGQTGVWTASEFLSLPSANPTNRTPVEIVDQSAGTAGRSLVYYIREGFRHRPTFRLTDINEPRFRVIVATVPRLSDSPDSSTVYSVAWTYITGDQSSGFRTFFLDQTVGYADANALADSAQTLVSRTDSIIAYLGSGILGRIK